MAVYTFPATAQFGDVLKLSLGRRVVDRDLRVVDEAEERFPVISGVPHGSSELAAAGTYHPAARSARLGRKRLEFRRCSEAKRRGLCPNSRIFQVAMLMLSSSRDAGAPARSVRRSSLLPRNPCRPA